MVDSMDCIKIASETSICEKYRSLTENCICEKNSVSEYSPCPVHDDECLIRQIYSPIHVDEETGRLTSLAFQDASLHLKVCQSIEKTIFQKRN